ncbi:MAG: hypothetical protein JXB26_08680 [Candidatus Aminicenantes bacterium]|nr:hypothetical protein [Candidatus Aminicenantes bacterium]
MKLKKIPYRHIYLLLPAVLILGGSAVTAQKKEKPSVQEIEKKPKPENNVEEIFDIGFLPRDEVAERSADLRLADPFGIGHGERPRFFYDSQRKIFYTRLYSRIHNIGNQAVKSESITVHFFFLEMDESNRAEQSGLWVKIGDYTFFPGSGPPLIHPGEVLCQDREVIWRFEPGETFPLRFMMKAEVVFPNDSDSSNNITIGFYDLTRSEQEATVAFSVDLSDKNEGETCSKMEVGNILGDGAKMFTALMEDGYRFGIYGLYGGNPGNSSITSTFRDQEGSEHVISLDRTQVIFPLQRITGTAKRKEAISKISLKKSKTKLPLGQGLLRAKEALFQSSFEENSGPKSLVILSNGIQEEAPFLIIQPPYLRQKEEQHPPIDIQKTFEKKAGLIKSIIFGPAMGWAFDLMSRVRDQNGGNFIYGNSSVLDLAASLFGVRGTTSGMVYFFDRGQTAFGTQQPFFEVNFDDAAREATVALSWPRPKKNMILNLEYRFKGNEKWKKSGMETGEYFSEINYFSGELCFKVFRFLPGAGTTWEFRVNPDSPRSPGIKFAVAVFSEIEHAKLDAHLDGDDFKAGNPLKVLAELKTEKSSETGATVYALIRVPLCSFSNILRRNRRSFSKLLEKGHDRVEAMTEKLVRDTQNQAELYPVQDLWIRLSDDGKGPDEVSGDGLYTGVLPGEFTRKTGVYSVIVKAAGTLPVGRTYSRYAVLSTIVSPAGADPDKSRVHMDLSDPEEDGTRKVDVTILPSDRFGNAVFPGAADRVDVFKIGQGSYLKGGIEDNLDSTFSQKMVLQPDRKAEIEVRFDGLSLGAFSVKPIRRHEAVFHFGVVAPEGEFDKTVTSGNSLAVDYTYRFTPHLCLRNEFCCNRFDNRKHGVRLFYNVTSYLQYRHPLGVITPYFQSGIGFYSLEDADQAMGYSAGIGLYYTVNKRWKIDFSFRGHRVGRKLDLGFIQTYLAAVYTF